MSGRLQRAATDPAVPYEKARHRRRGRTAIVAEFRQLADRLEQLPLADVAEVLVLLEPTLDDLRRQAAFVLERAPHP
jgi:hypothetical protein